MGVILTSNLQEDWFNDLFIMHANNFDENFFRKTMSKQKTFLSKRIKGFKFVASCKNIFFRILQGCTFQFG